MKFQGALVKEQGVTFAIVVVKNHIVSSPTQSDQTISAFSSIFPNMPIVLMAQNSKGTPTYRGRQDIVNFLARVHPARIPWKEYSVN